MASWTGQNSSFAVVSSGIKPSLAASLFGGTAEVKSAGGIKLQLSVKAKTQGLNMQFPIRKYYPQGTYSANDKSQVISSKDTDDTCLIAPFVPRKEVLI